MPLLIDGDAVVPEASIIIEHLQRHHPGPVPMIPTDPLAALRVRLLDRLADNDLMTPTQTIVFDRARDQADRDPPGVRQTRGMLDSAYPWWDGHMPGGTVTWRGGTGQRTASAWPIAPPPQRCPAPTGFTRSPPGAHRAPCPRAAV